jgi:hypothetical protein
MENICITTKKSPFLDGFKPSINGKKPFGIKSRRFFVDGLKPSKIFCPEFGFWTVWAKPSRIVDGFAQTVQN